MMIYHQRPIISLLDRKSRRPNVLSYTRKNPEASRLISVSIDEAQSIGKSDLQLIDVTSGLKFLHGMSLVHGNIRSISTGVVVNHNPLLRISAVEYSDKR